MMKRRGVMILLLLLVLIVGAGGLAAYLYYSNYVDVTVNGFDATKMSTEEIAQRLADYFNEQTVTIQEDGKDELTGTLEDFGYVCDVEGTARKFTDTYRDASGNLSALIRRLQEGGIEITSAMAWKFDEAAFEEYVQSESFATERVPYADGSVEFSEEALAYVVSETVQGNEIQDDKLQKTVKAAIEEAITDQVPQAVIIEVPEKDYVVKSEDTTISNEALQERAAVLNQHAGAKINYTFGEEVVTLDFSTIKDWETLQEDNTLTLDESALQTYVENLASTYNTRFKNRTFTTTAGEQITIDAVKNEYGYTISKDDEIAQLKADIEGNQEVTREPVYISQNEYGNPVYLARNGVDDLAGTYVEVDLSTQKLWFYKNGTLLVETDIVSGTVSKNRQTATGVYPLAYKESPSVLASDVNGYEVDVNYWMPFYDGQGLHDASWRSEFGGTIFRTSGSHGCVNLPENAAKSIYENIDSGTAIILYQSAGEEELPEEDSEEEVDSEAETDGD